MAIYDCFTFFNEIDLLKIRLSLLNEYIDYFVIVEMNKTQRGIEKDFNFEKHINEFEKYRKKIIYIKVDDSPHYSGIYGDWKLENFQRNCIMRGLNECEPEDIIIISDLDEIPNPDIIANINSVKVSLVNPQDRLFSRTGIYSMLRQFFRLMSISPKLFFREKNCINVLEKTAVILKQDIYYYYLNCKSRGYLHGTVIMKFKNMLLPHNCRNLRYALPCVKNGGWHFSYLGGRKKIKEKLKAIIEGNDYAMRDHSNDDEYIDNCLSKGIDLFGRKGREFEYEFIVKEDIGLNNINDIIEKYPDFYKSI